MKTINSQRKTFAIFTNEFIIIHPFREGNGRAARLLADLMSLQSNQKTLNYRMIDQIENPNGFMEYVKAIHRGFNNDYQAIQDIFMKLLNET